MSLDVYLKKPGVQGVARYGVIFVRENGGNVELTREALIGAMERAVKKVKGGL